MAIRRNRYSHRAAAGCIALVLAASAFAPIALADTVPGNKLVEQSMFVSGSSTTVFSFTASTPGTFTVHLENLAWPVRLADLNCSVFSSDSIMGSLAGTNDMNILVGVAGIYYASVSGTAAGLLNLGLYSFRVTFAPALSSVDLPASAGMLLLGLLGMLGTKVMARRNLSVTYAT